MALWIESVADWDRSLPAILVATAGASGERRALLRGLTAAVLGLSPDEVIVAHADGQPPRLMSPPGSGLHLSAASRGPVAAVAVAGGPIGVDVELARTGAEIPWHVLEAGEAASLKSLDPVTLAQAFARLWSVKEAYLKARGIGLFREPSSFRVTFIDAERAVVHDPVGETVAEAVTTWRSADHAPAVISAVFPAPQPREGGPAG